MTGVTVFPVAHVPSGIWKVEADNERTIQRFAFQMRQFNLHFGRTRRRKVNWIFRRNSLIIDCEDRMDRE